MAEIVLFHHAQGLTEGVRAFAGSLREAGHVVHLPDLYEGKVFETLDEGIDYARQTGFGVVKERGLAAADALNGGAANGLVYAGLSLGAMPAQELAQTRPGARGALLLHGCIPVSEFGESWPAGVPVQVHAMEQDPFFIEEGGDLDAAKALVAAAPGEAELFLYPGKEHLFSDSSLPAYDEDATKLLISRVLAFLD
ncbi:dienelactone hydrolase family protein [Kribbella sp. CA-293567]|uniref:dienelactone hydrolase family protein n=1 Tax=Kribbella sp. CA-293567 TaxID=3002436 RepID=UPI0022DDA560|nr:dienelactone hydrolase family protein [Kribbella sp. CA-293567]WBQ02830.1 dienelactone hydrolase family protein [Kribbella sp. CA-293567]